MHQHASGFTLVELVVVLVLIGILAVYAAPRFTTRGSYSALTVQQDLIQSIRFAQQLAMSRTDRTISVVITANSINIQQGGVDIGNPYPKSTGTDVSLSPTNLVFTRLGTTSDTNISITGPTAQPLTVTVTGATGYAR